MKIGWYILCYHNISWEENPYIRGIGGTCPPDIFRDHIVHLYEVGEFVSISEGLSRLRGGNINNPIFSFWFDDGLSGPRKYALPLLKQHNTTAAFSICSRFVDRSEFFWLFKLSYLSYVDGLRFLRGRLRKYGYEQGKSVKTFCLAKFSESIVQEIDSVFRVFTSEAERQDAFRLFETDSGLLELLRENWIMGNHTAAHYPIGEDIFADNFYSQFIECEIKFKELFAEESKFWVLPFGSLGRPHTNKVVETFRQLTDDRYLVLVGNKRNDPPNIKERIIFRINTPICPGSDLLKLLGKL